MNTTSEPVFHQPAKQQAAESSEGWCSEGGVHPPVDWAAFDRWAEERWLCWNAVDAAEEAAKKATKYAFRYDVS